jgi:hypothetical protein
MTWSSTDLRVCSSWSDRFLKYVVISYNSLNQAWEKLKSY